MKRKTFMILMILLILACMSCFIGGMSVNPENKLMQAYDRWFEHYEAIITVLSISMITAGFVISRILMRMARRAKKAK